MSAAPGGQRRLQRVREKLAAENLDAFVTTNGANRRYLTGFTGSAGMAVILPTAAVLLVDFRYTEQARRQAFDWDVREVESFLEALSDLFTAARVRRAGFEAAHVTYAAARRLQEKVETVEWVATEGIVEWVRAIKEGHELAAIRRAVALGDRAFSYMLERVCPGVSEQELALELEFFLRREGAEGMSFPPIVASGPNAALAHARPTDRRLGSGDFLLLDFGCIVDGYCSDMTRTVCLGPADPEQKAVYDVVLRAQRAGLAALRPGAKGNEVDGAARAIIDTAGYGDRFGHGLGHGVGMEVHEDIPRLNKRSDVVLQPGMVTSVEPGVYVPGWGGVRIEDLAIVTVEGAEVLTQSPKELIQLPV